MSLKARALPRVAKLAVLLIISALVPIQSASADLINNWTALNSTGIGSQYWSGAASSYTGSVLYVSATPGYIYKSVDSGTSWSRIDAAGNRAWLSVATNDSGTVVAAITSSGYLYLSIDSGSTWTSQNAAGSRSWTSLSMNSTGSVIGATYGSSTLQLTNDGGTNWNTITPGGSTLKGLTISGDGTRIAVSSGTNIYTSSDSGSTWTTNTNMFMAGAAGAYSISMSRDGQKIAALGGMNSNPNFDDKARVTSNFGTTWETATAHSTSRVPIAIALSGDGSRMLLTDPNGNIKYSANLGTSYSTGTGSTGSWTAVASNYTGTRAIAVSSTATYNSGIYISADSGATWTNKPITDGISRFTRIEASSDGSKIIAVTMYGRVWISSDSGATWSIAPNISANFQPTCIAISSNGSKIFLGGPNDRSWLSSNGGTSFAVVNDSVFASNQYVYSCSMSADGKIIAAAVNSTGILMSSDGGATFPTVLPNLYSGTTYYFSSVTMSADGTKIAVQPGNGGTTPVIVSTDTGTTWSSSATTSNGYALKSSGDGSVLIQYYNLYPNTPRISRNWGGSWSTMPSTFGNSFGEAVSISYDGSMIVFGQNSSTGLVYQSADSGATFTQVTGVATGTQRALKLTANKNMLLLGTDGQTLMKASVQITPKGSFSPLALSASAAFRTSSTITATLSVAGSDGKVTFFANGKKIAGCIKVQSASLIATCNWKPAVRGAVTLSAISYPNDSNYLSGTVSLPIVVTSRSGRR